jgi:predicted phage gp36 major capsid-like protein
LAPLISKQHEVRNAALGGRRLRVDNQKRTENEYRQMLRLAEIENKELKDSLRYVEVQLAKTKDTLRQTNKKLDETTEEVQNCHEQISR